MSDVLVVCSASSECKWSDECLHGSAHIPKHLFSTNSECTQTPTKCENGHTCQCVPEAK